MKIGCYKIIFNHINFKNYHLYFINVIKNCKLINYQEKISGSAAFKHLAIFSDVENAHKYKNELCKKYTNRCKCKENGYFPQ